MGGRFSEIARTGSDVLEKIPDLSWVNTILFDAPYKCSALRALRGAVGLFVSACGNVRDAALAHVHMAFFVCPCTHASVRQMEHR